MEDRIIDDKYFEIIIDSCKYKCKIYTDITEELHFIKMYKIIERKFLFWKYDSVEYLLDELLGIGDSVAHENYLNNCYYAVDDVTKWCKNQLNINSLDAKQKQFELQQINNFNLVTIIDD